MRKKTFSSSRFPAGIGFLLEPGERLADAISLSTSRIKWVKLKNNKTDSGTLVKDNNTSGVLLEYEQTFR